MNSSLIITYVIGGLFLISILTFNIQVMNTSQEFALNTFTQEKMDNLIEIIDHDFNKIGFNVATAVPFNSISSQSVSFQSDVYDNDNFGVTNVQWFFDTSDRVISTTNPNDFYLKRVGPIGPSTQGTIEFPVTYFDLKYYTADGTPTNVRSEVRKVELEIIIESGEPYYLNKDNPQYTKRVWKRIFVPNNINFPF